MIKKFDSQDNKKPDLKLREELLKNKIIEKIIGIQDFKDINIYEELLSDAKLWTIGEDQSPLTNDEVKFVRKIFIVFYAYSWGPLIGVLIQVLLESIDPSLSLNLPFKTFGGMDEFLAFVEVCLAIDISVRCVNVDHYDSQQMTVIQMYKELTSNI